MKRKILQIVVGIAGLIMVGRFGIPGTFLGPAWVQADESNVFLDSDFRFLSVMMMGVGALFFWMIPRIEQHVMLMRILMLSFLIGGIVRIISIYTVGMPPVPALVALGIEFVVPAICLPLQNAIRAETDH